MEKKESPIIVAVFTDIAQAKQAYDNLQSSGYGADHLGLADPRTDSKGMEKHLEQAGVSESDSHYYQQEFEAGHPLLTVRVGGLRYEAIEKALTLLQQHGAYDAVSGREGGGKFGSHVKTDARTPFFDITNGVLETEDH